MQTDKIIKIAIALVVGFVIITIFWWFLKKLLWLGFVAAGAYFVYQVFFTDKKQIK